MVIAAVGVNGQISLFNFAGSVDVVVDVLGWFPTGNAYNGLSPARLLDTRSVAPPPPPPPPPAPAPAAVATLQPGTLVVNSNVAPGRYIAVNAASGCYWERLRGFGGSLGEIIANDFQGFTGQVIVDILSTDAGFSFEAGCGTFKTYVPPATTVASVTPGAHVVGADIVAGTYTTNAAANCYWERTTSFQGTISAIIANDFVSAAGPLVVTISPTDVGFYTDADCGTWTRV
jgi:hypothetical protein